MANSEGYSEKERKTKRQQQKTKPEGCAVNLKIGKSLLDIPIRMTFLSKSATQTWTGMGLETKAINLTSSMKRYTTRSLRLAKGHGGGARGREGRRGAGGENTTGTGGRGGVVREVSERGWWSEVLCCVKPRI